MNRYQSGCMGGGQPQESYMKEHVTCYIHDINNPAVIIDQAVFGMARAGTLDGNSKYPLILDSSSEDGLWLKPGVIGVAGKNISLPGIMAQSEKNKWLTDADREIAMIPDAVLLLQRPARLLNRIFELRRELGFRPLIYAPGIGDPYLMPALVYAGISIFDDLFIRAESVQNRLYSPLGITGCSENCLVKNLEFAQDMMSVIRKSVENKTLREITEKYQVSSRAVEILRSLDLNWYDEIERLYPSRTPYIKANTVDALLRPDLLRYREYVSGHYEKPAGKEIALLLPCTARKPYYQSKTHMKIFSRLEKYRDAIHKVVVTSPVGIVPEELEETYPPAFYDIPTIGRWYEDEKVMIGDMLEKYFSRNQYSHVIAYITPDLSFIADKLPEGSEIIKGRIRDEEMLKQLNDSVKAVYNEPRGNKSVNHKFQVLTETARYQFGDWILPYVREMRLTRSYNQDMLTRDGKVMLVYNQKLGKLTITKEMGKIFISEQKNTVHIDDFKPTANIYAMGVLDVSQETRQEDEVVLEFEGEVRGVGIAKMPAGYMKDLSKGIAVKVRN